MMLLVDLIFFSSCPLYKIKNKYLQFHASPATKNLCMKMKNGMKIFVSNQPYLNCTYLLTSRESYKLRTNWAKVNDKIWPIFSTKSTQICMKTSLTCLLRGY